MKREDITSLFRSGHEACRFAYAYSSQQYAMTAMAKMMRGPACGSGRGLIGLEGAAVAGTVKRHVESLPHPAPAIIGARYEIDRLQAIFHTAILVDFVIPALGTGGHHRHLVRALICRYFRIPDADGKPVRLAALADRFGMSADTITRRWKATRDRLRGADSKAGREIDDRLQSVGLID